MVLFIYGAPVSQPVRAVMWACIMHGLPYELKLTLPRRKEAGVGAQHPDYLKMNPWGNIPTISARTSK